MRKTVAIEGRVTIDNSPAMRKKLADALGLKPEELTLDFSRVTYIETSGLATLVEASRIAHQQGTRLVLSGMQGQAQFLLKVTDLDHFFDIVSE